MKAFLTLCILLLLVLPAFCGEYSFIGEVIKVKTEAPYPFLTADGRIWECKVKIEYYWYDPEYGWYEVKYKAYPLRFSGYEWACSLPEGTMVQAFVYSKSDRMPPRRGDILSLVVLE